LEENLFKLRVHNERQKSSPGKAITNWVVMLPGARADRGRLPVGASPTCARLLGKVDELVCLGRPELFQAVGPWYEELEQTSDQEVRNLLKTAAAAAPE